MIRMNAFKIRIHKNVRIKFKCVLCCFKNQCWLTHSNFSWWWRLKKYYFAEKEKLAKLCIKHKEKNDSQREVVKYSGKKESLLTQVLMQRVSFIDL